MRDKLHIPGNPNMIPHLNHLPLAGSDASRAGELIAALGMIDPRTGEFHPRIMDDPSLHWGSSPQALRIRTARLVVSQREYEG